MPPRFAQKGNKWIVFADDAVPVPAAPSNGANGRAVAYTNRG